MAKRTKNIKKTKRKLVLSKKWHAAPLKASFMAASLLGIFITIYYLFDLMGQTWGLAFLILFVLMLIASLVSMTKAPVME